MVPLKVHCAGSKQCLQTTLPTRSRAFSQQKKQLIFVSQPQRFVTMLPPLGEVLAIVCIIAHACVEKSKSLSPRHTGEPAEQNWRLTFSARGGVSVRPYVAPRDAK
jgi:hypothetical protein